MRSLLVVAHAAGLCLALTGCQLGGVDAAPPAAGEPSFDDPAAATSCLLRPPLELGRCVTGSGAPCQGTPGETTRFVPLADREAIAWRQGPDGLELALAIRGVGMAVGETAMAEVVVSRDTGEQVTRQQGPLHFTGDAFMAESTALIVLMDASRPAPGDVLRTTVLIEDRNHERRCGRRHLLLQARP